jgi:hypothetical protein
VGILTSQVYEEKEVQVEDETVGKSLQSMRKVKEEIFSNLSRVINSLLITQILSYNSCYIQYLHICYL